MVPARYRLIWRDDQHRDHIRHDPYVFPPQLSEVVLQIDEGAAAAPTLLKLC